MKYEAKRTEFFNNKFRYKTNDDPFDLTLGSQEEFNAFLKVAKVKKDFRLIELGCGNGRIVLPLLKYGCTVTGVDIAKDALSALSKRAKEYGVNKNLIAVYADFKKAQPKLEEKFDVGYIVSTLHELSSNKKERLGIFKNFTRTIKKNGKVVVLQPNPLNPLFYPFIILDPRMSWEVEKNFMYTNRWTIPEMMKEAGITDISLTPFGFLPGFTMNTFPIIKYVNRIGSSLPVVNLFSTFIFYSGRKL